MLTITSHCVDLDILLKYPNRKLIVSHVFRSPHINSAKVFYLCTIGCPFLKACFELLELLAFYVLLGDAAGEKIVSISGSSDTITALSDKGEIFIWGQCEYGQALLGADSVQVRLSCRAWWLLLASRSSDESVSLRTVSTRKDSFHRINDKLLRCKHFMWRGALTTLKASFMCCVMPFFLKLGRCHSSS